MWICVYHISLAIRNLVSDGEYLRELCVVVVMIVGIMGLVFL